MSVWHYADPVRGPQGPVPAEVLIELFGENRITGDTLVWREGLSTWERLDAMADEIGLPTTSPPGLPDASPQQPWHDEATPSAFEPHGDTDGALPSESPYAAPQAALANASLAVPGGEVVLAGFWKRAAAYFIDYFIVSIIGGIAGALLGGGMEFLLDLDATPGQPGYLLIQGVSFLLGLVIGATYFGWFHASPQQATPGKMAIGIKVVRGDGERITFLRGIGRYFGFLLSSLILCIGFIMAAFTARKQALHDLISDTLVVDKWAYTHHPERQRHELGVVTWVVLGLGLLLTVGVLVVMGFAFWALLRTM